MIDFLYQYSAAFFLGVIFGGTIVGFLVDRIYQNSFFNIEQNLKKERGE